MTKVSDILAFLESIAPFKYQEDYDNAGLIVGSPDMITKGVMVSLDATEEVIEDAIAHNCNVVVSHHPIVFGGLKKINGKNYVERAVIKAIKNDIALIAIHTNLDNVLTNGVNEKIAQKLGLKDLEILAPKKVDNIDENIGAGIVGTLIEPLSPDAFLSHVKTSMELNLIKHTAKGAKSIKKVAVCGGAGSFLLQQAKASGAQAFITSDYKYHEFFDAEDEIIILDIGHFESEKYTIDLLYDLISNNFSTFASHYTSIITNPVFYFK